MEETEIKTESVENTAPQAPQASRVPENLNQQQALQVLVDAARFAQSKGIFTVEDAELISKAIRAFMPQGPVATQG